tara:strand:+ start:3900 stop:4301 length:402 start_codon:yes stop_codon:yes gene_type:complete
MIEMKNVSSKKIYRDFGFVFGLLFPLFIGIFIPFLFGHDFRLWTFFVTIPLFGLALFCPLKLKNLYQFWIWLGNLLGFLNSRLILGFIFYFLLFPISLVMKIIGHDPLKRNKNKKNTYKEFRKNDSINFEDIF